MRKLGIKALIIIFVFTNIFACLSFSDGEDDNNTSSNTDSVIDEAEYRLLGITEEERNVLEELFAEQKKIELLEYQEIALEEELQSLEKEIISIEESIVAQKELYEKNKEALKNVLKAYQRSGSNTFLQIILKSKNIGDFTTRVNTLRELSKNTGALLSDMEETKAFLDMSMMAIEDKERSIRSSKDELQNSKEEIVELTVKLEEKLDQLKDDKDKYAKYLENLKLIWNESSEVIGDAMDELSDAVNNGILSESIITLDISFFDVKGTILENDLNQMLSKNELLSDIEFEFRDDYIELMIPSKNLTLYGKFVIEEPNVIVLEIERGEFLGMELGKNSIDELFKNGMMTIDMRQILGKSKLQEISVYEDRVELKIKPVYF